ncbi:uncharacterized protein LOC100678853 isoform X3 [Nasonia vitripennis]|uniref:Uncharacterized protein n=1 Tax=Nasonia vitripennis TaxID=7425 RepID=A0A7M7PYS5_NASVI|nr:uncharacterized protein LOC100678853 isoform X3 [Nasonia vitripennis]XP_031778192.1 uncharacterized protein LOC100678853 isoform X3 [Nasonia vitripennis]XP_031778193.1 uncharacterized protein LOC100678853 isoform X3 [Nasonia vitripennis]
MVVIEQQNDADLENNEASKDYNVGDILRAPRTSKCFNKLATASKRLVTVNKRFATAKGRLA